MKRLMALVMVGLWSLAPAAQGGDKKVLRAGMIGLDTSHVPAFTKLLNKSVEGSELSGVRVVVGFPGGSKDVKESYSRVEGFTKTLRDQYGVEIVNSIDELVAKVDVVFIESVDGRPHLEQAIPVLKAGKVLFIDKPIAGSLADALMIFELAKKYKAPVFSSSSLRFHPGIVGANSNEKVGKVVGCLAYGPCSLQEHHPDLFWYGIHGVESLFTVMGTGCKTVARTHTKNTDVVTGLWNDGRVGTYRGIRGAASPGDVLLFGTKGIALAGGKGGYDGLVKEIVKFFKTGQPPVSAEETIEIFAFMEAADESKRQGGAPVALETVLQKARAENAKRTLP
jgi:hypothetical protein